MKYAKISIILVCLNTCSFYKCSLLLSALKSCWDFYQKSLLKSYFLFNFYNKMTQWMCDAGILKRDDLVHIAKLAEQAER